MPHSKYQEAFMSRSVEYDPVTKITRSDYRTAHDNAGDPDRTVWLPETCITCRRQEVSKLEALGESPTAPDEDWPLSG